MTVHMVRICVGPQSSWAQSDVNAAVEDWMSKQSEWTADTQEHTMTEQVPSVTDTPVWWQGDYRLTFESEPKDNLLQKLEDKLVTKPDWYRFGYHECGHDESDRTECPSGPPGDPWDDERSDTAKNVTIPPEVPEFV